VLTIDGSLGEGGGQVFRTSLALSLVTGRPFRIERIRAGRRKPGLMRQHLTALRAAQKISGARVEGDSLGSGTVKFTPDAIKPGEYHFAVGSAGSATLVLQAVLPALMTANGVSKLTLEGGTHNPHAPPFDFLARTYLPLLNRMGPAVEAALVRPGFYPAGGGKMKVTVEPSVDLGRLDLQERGEIRSRRARAVVSKLPRSIAEREVKEFRSRLDWPEECFSVETVEDSPGAGNVMMVEVEGEQLTEVFTGFGERGVKAETVASRAAKAVKEYLAADIPVGRHLADQLLIPLAMAGAGSFNTFPLSRHTTTNSTIIEKFLDVSITAEAGDRNVHKITVSADTGPGARQVSTCGHHQS
jgi:RNA 3'-terminal phosphate cyclase (ATP)